eukprot:4542122-Amphidinium_carterae.1
MARRRLGSIPPYIEYDTCHIQPSSCMAQPTGSHHYQRRKRSRTSTPRQKQREPPKPPKIKNGEKVGKTWGKMRKTIKFP